MARQPQALDYTSGTISDSAVTILGMGSALITTIPTGARSFVGTIESALYEQEEMAQVQQGQRVN